MKKDHVCCMHCDNLGGPHPSPHGQRITKILTKDQVGGTEWRFKYPVTENILKGMENKIFRAGNVFAFAEDGPGIYSPCIWKECGHLERVPKNAEVTQVIK